MKTIVNLSYFETDTLNTVVSRLSEFKPEQEITLNQVGLLSFFDLLTNLNEEKFSKLKELKLKINSVYLPVYDTYSELTEPASLLFLKRLKELNVKTILIRPIFLKSTKLELKKELLKLKWLLRGFKIIFQLKESQDHLTLKTLIDKKLKFKLYFDPVYFYLNNLGAIGNFKIFLKHIELLRMTDIDELGQGEFLNFGIVGVNQMAMQLKLHGLKPDLILDSRTNCFFQGDKQNPNLNKKSRNVLELQLLNQPEVYFNSVLKSEHQGLETLISAILD